MGQELQHHRYPQSLGVPGTWGPPGPPPTAVRRTLHPLQRSEVRAQMASPAPCSLLLAAKRLLRGWRPAPCFAGRSFGGLPPCSLGTLGWRREAWGGPCKPMHQVPRPPKSPVPPGYKQTGRQACVGGLGSCRARGRWARTKLSTSRTGARGYLGDSGCSQRSSHRSRLPLHPPPKHPNSPTRDLPHMARCSPSVVRLRCEPPRP